MSECICDSENGGLLSGWNSGEYIILNDDDGGRARSLAELDPLPCPVRPLQHLKPQSDLVHRSTTAIAHCRY